MNIITLTIISAALSVLIHFYYTTTAFPRSSPHRVSLEGIIYEECPPYPYNAGCGPTFWEAYAPLMFTAWVIIIYTAIAAALVYRWLVPARQVILDIPPPYAPPMPDVAPPQILHAELNPPEILHLPPPEMAHPQIFPLNLEPPQLPPPQLEPPEIFPSQLEPTNAIPPIPTPELPFAQVIPLDPGLADIASVNLAPVEHAAENAPSSPLLHLNIISSEEEINFEIRIADYEILAVNASLMLQCMFPGSTECVSPYSLLIHPSQTAYGWLAAWIFEVLRFADADNNVAYISLLLITHFRAQMSELDARNCTFALRGLFLVMYALAWQLVDACALHAMECDCSLCEKAWPWPRVQCCKLKAAVSFFRHHFERYYDLDIQPEILKEFKPMIDTLLPFWFEHELPSIMDYEIYMDVTSLQSIVFPNGPYRGEGVQFRSMRHLVSSVSITHRSTEATSDFEGPATVENDARLDAADSGPAALLDDESNVCVALNWKQLVSAFEAAGGRMDDADSDADDNFVDATSDAGDDVPNVNNAFIGEDVDGHVDDNLNEEVDADVNEEVDEGAGGHAHEAIDEELAEELVEAVNNDVENQVNGGLDGDFDLNVDRDLDGDLDEEVAQEVNGDVNEAVVEEFNEEIDEEANVEVVNKDVETEVDRNINGAKAMRLVPATVAFVQPPPDEPVLVQPTVLFNEALPLQTIAPEPPSQSSNIQLHKLSAPETPIRHNFYFIGFPKTPKQKRR